jgi:hypothetical protein
MGHELFYFLLRQMLMKPRRIFGGRCVRQGLAMGSSDYLNSARRATTAFFVLAFVALAAAGYNLAISAWSGPQVASAPAVKLSTPSHRRALPACFAKPAPDCASVEVAQGGAGLSP